MFPLYWFKQWFNRPFRRALRKYPWLKTLRPGDVVIDCGANVGLFTVPMAETGAIVYAFEPNPHAFETLASQTKRFHNVVCFQQAVGSENTTLKLYMHVRASEDPVKWSTGSTLVSSKTGIRQDDYVDVDCIDLSHFIATLDKPVKLLKMDVEGAECDILLKLIEKDQLQHIGKVFCEMHDDERIPEIQEKGKQVRRLVQFLNLKHVDLAWV